MAILLFDPPSIKTNLLPFTFTRPVSEIRTGILTITEKWKKSLNAEIFWLTDTYLEKKYPSRFDKENIYINGALCPDEKIVEKILALSNQEALYKNKQLLAFNANASLTVESIEEHASSLTSIQYEYELSLIDKIWKIFLLNGEHIKADLRFFKHIKGIKIDDPFTQIYAPDNIYVEDGAKVRAAILNADNGPIYLGKNS